jgi:succinate dehydrogenase/fumarate reductase flavoprotein subunit
MRRYASFFDDGVDLDFNRDLKVAMPFEGDGYCALRTNPINLVTVSGLLVDEDLRVIDWSGDPIHGLYAVGDCSGGMFSGNYPRGHGGIATGRAVTFGYVAGQRAAERVQVANR